MKVSEAGKVSKLAAAMLLVAVRDLRYKRTCLEASLFFVGEDFAFWAELANIPFADPLEPFRGLSIYHARILLAQIKTLPSFGGWVIDGETYSHKQVRTLKREVQAILYKKVGGFKTGNRYTARKVKNDIRQQYQPQK